MAIERIESEDDIAAGIRALRRKCAVMRRVHDTCGTPPVRIQEPGFEGLCRIIVGQQLSVASAAAIWGRCQRNLIPMTPQRINRARETTLRAAGLSAPKIRTLKAMSKAVLAGDLDLAPGAYANDADLLQALVAVSGIGPWTADIYFMFALGKPDAFATGDLALQVGAQLAFGLEDRPGPEELEAVAEVWRPWRGVAAGLLWHYYGHLKSTRSALPV